MNAEEIGTKAVDTISARGKERDQPTGERSMLRTVEAFNALTGASLTEREGWLFMVILKAARSCQGRHNLDDYVDGAAYFMLAGECADDRRTVAFDAPERISLTEVNT